MIRRRVAGSACVVLLALGLVAGAAGPASAHALLIATSPGIGSEVDAPPVSVTLTFDETVVASPRAIVVTAGGLRLDDGNPVHPGGDTHALRVGLRTGPSRGSYAVLWRVGSADGHPVDGSFSIGVAQPAGAAPPLSEVSGSTAVSGADKVLQGLAYLGLVVGLGVPLTVGFLWPGVAGQGRTRRLVAAGWGLEVMASVGLLAVRGPVTAGTGITTVFDVSELSQTLSTRSGRLVLARLVVLVLMVPALRRLLLRAGSAAVDLAVLGGLLAVSFPLGDHAGNGAGAPLAVLLGTLHVLAATVWLGGLAVIAAGLLPRDARLRAWSRVAAGSVAVLVVTGLLATWREVHGWPALTGTSYGHTLLVKSAVVVGLLLVAETARRGVAGGGVASSLRRGVAVETALGVVVLGVTAVLVGAQPAREAYPAPRTLAVTLSGGAGSLQGRVDFDRTRLGPEQLQVVLTDAGGRPVAAASIDGLLADVAHEDDPLRFALVSGGVGRGAASVELPETGQWTLTLQVRGTAAGDVAGQASYEVT